MNSIARLWHWLSRPGPREAVSPLSEKYAAEERLRRIEARLTAIETRWWATHGGQPPEQRKREHS